MTFATIRGIFDPGDAAWNAAIGPLRRAVDCIGEGVCEMANVRALQSDDLTEAGPGIYYTHRAVPFVDKATIEFLKQAARTVPRRRARLCAHPSPDADQHDMLIASHRDTYVVPHRHHQKAETFLVLEGLADVMLFDETGKLTDLIPMGAASSGRPFFYRMPPKIFHSLSIDSELLVFVESTKGPFRSSESENASWAPGPDDAVEGRAFIASVLKLRG
jgi:cupin fold WbuC family metalloprotein